MRVFLVWLLLCGVSFAQEKQRVIKVTFEGNNTLALIEGEPDDLKEFLVNFKYKFSVSDSLRDSREHVKDLRYLYKWKKLRISIYHKENRENFETTMNEWHHSDGGRLIWVTNPAPSLK